MTQCMKRLSVVDVVVVSRCYNSVIIIIIVLVVVIVVVVVV